VSVTSPGFGSDTGERLRTDEELVTAPFYMEGERGQLHRWERRFSRTLNVSGFLFLIAYALPILFDGLHPEIASFCDILVGVLWAAFAVDFVIRVILASDKREFFTRKRNIFDLLTLAVPMMRPLRALAVMQQFTQWATNSLRGKWLTYVISGAVLLVLVGSLAAFDAERGRYGATITSWPIALSWAFEAVTDVGFGEYQPVTALGHIIGIVLMLAGVALMGFIIAAISSWFIENLSEQLHDKKAPSTVGQVEELTRIDQEILEALRMAPLDTIKQLPTPQPPSSE
jgi:voltage-gated potassium channel